MSTQTPNLATQRGEASSPAAVTSQRIRLALEFGAFAVAALLLFWRQLTTIADLWFRDGALSIGALVPFVSAFFGWRAWKETEGLEIEQAVSGFIVAIGAALVIIISNLASHHGLTLCAIFMPLFLAGAMASAAGWQYVKAFTFPLAFLWFILPVPPALFTVVDRPLQLLCARFVEMAAHLLHMPVVRSGTIVGPTRDIAIDVAPECDGIRSSITLFTLSVLLSRIMRLRITAGIMLALIAIPLAYAANFLRLTGLFLMMHALGEPFMNYEHYFDLTSGGVWFFCIVLLLIAIAQRLPRHKRNEAPV